MDEKDRERIVDRLRAFMADMRAWELRCAEREAAEERDEISYDEVKAAGLSEYSELFARHCSALRAIPRSEFWYHTPPDHDPDNEPIEDIRLLPDGTAEVLARQEFKFKYRYVYRLLNEDGDWRLFQRLRVAPSGELRVEEL